MKCAKNFTTLTTINLSFNNGKWLNRAIKRETTVMQ
jgi:hypothetical protein